MFLSPLSHIHIAIDCVDCIFHKKKVSLYPFKYYLLFYEIIKQRRIFNSYSRPYLSASLRVAQLRPLSASCQTANTYPGDATFVLEYNDLKSV